MGTGQVTVRIEVVDNFTDEMARAMLKVDELRAIILQAATNIRWLLAKTGHRHRYSRDWALRYAPARKDLPLGQRTDAKRRALRA